MRFRVQGSVNAGVWEAIVGEYANRVDAVQQIGELAQQYGQFQHIYAQEPIVRRPIMQIMGSAIIDSRRILGVNFQ